MHLSSKVPTGRVTDPNPHSYLIIGVWGQRLQPKDKSVHGERATLGMCGHSIKNIFWKEIFSENKCYFIYLLL